MAVNPNKTIPSIELQLHAFVERLENHPFGWRALVLNLSRLRPDTSRARQIRLAANTFQGLAQQFEGRIFVLQQGDIVFVCKDADLAAVDNALNKIHFLFGDDPLTSQFDDGHPDGFTTWYDLSRDYVKFASLVQHIYSEEQRRQKRLATIQGGAQKDQRQPMDPAALGELVATIARADLTPVLRRQSVCMVSPGDAPKPIYRELYVSIADLRDAVLPKRDIASDRWLFQCLTQTLDKRVLALLRRTEDSTLWHSFSVNLNVSTLLSPDFQAFDQSLRPGTRGSIVIELEKVDIFNDLGAYIFARDSLRDRGYRLCLDGVTALALPFIERERLGLDLVKLFWTPELGNDYRTGHTAELRAAIDRVGKSRLILAHCGDPEAIEFGLDAGIHLFQGRYVDRLLTSPGNVATKGRSVSAAPAAVSG